MAQIDRRSTRPGAEAGLAGLEQRPLVFPIEHGMIRARLSDATACFNLNSVVEGTGALWQRRESGSRQFTALLRAPDVPQVQSGGLVDSLVDCLASAQPHAPAAPPEPRHLLPATPPPPP